MSKFNQISINELVYLTAIENHNRAELEVKLSGGDILRVPAVKYIVATRLPIKEAIELDMELVRLNVRQYLAIKYPYANRKIAFELDTSYTGDPVLVKWIVRAYETYDRRSSIGQTGLDCLKEFIMFSRRILKETTGFELPDLEGRPFIDGVDRLEV